jgi:adenine deaminase
MENKRGGLHLTAREMQSLHQVALGVEKADLAVINARLVNVYTGEIQENHGVAVKGRCIALVGPDISAAVGRDTKIIDAMGKTIIPGLIEGHTHLASWTTVHEFLRLAMKGGTTTIITETMEVFPVAGYAGVMDFLQSLQDQPIRLLATAPAMASISRAALGVSPDIMQQLAGQQEIVGLGESYWQTVFQAPDAFVSNFEAMLENGKTLEGHSAGARGNKLAAYAAMGVSSCHESTSAQDVLERLRLGFYAMARVRVIDMVTDLVTREVIEEMPVSDGEILCQKHDGPVKISAIDRTRGAGKMFTGLIKNFGLHSGAMACSAAWDTSCIIVVGADDTDMALAVNRIHDIKGGVVVCDNNEITCELALPVFGILSELPVDQIARQLEKINTAAQKLGIDFPDPVLTLITLTGAAIPYLRICEQGLVNLKDGKTLGLFVKDTLGNDQTGRGI